MRWGNRPTADPWELLPPYELVACVQHAPVPEIPLASIRDLLAPVHDAAGDLVGWVLDASTFDDPAAVTTFTMWRRTWQQRWPIGPVSNVESLLREARTIDLELVGGLAALLERLLDADGATMCVEPLSAAQLVPELDVMRAALSAEDRTGFGIVDDMPRATRSEGLARTWAPPGREHVLVATGATALLVDAQGRLVLRRAGTGHPDVLGIISVDLRRDDAVVLDERGSTTRLPQEQARPLGWLVPRSLRWHVRTVPLVAVWTGIFDGLRTALVAASGAGAPVTIGADAGLR